MARRSDKNKVKSKHMNKNGIQKLGRGKVTENDFNFKRNDNGSGTVNLKNLPEIKPRNDKQAETLDAIDENKIVIMDGITGCGKTFLAIAKALQALADGEIEKIWLIRPYQPAGSDKEMGFLKGSEWDKMLPYISSMLEPLYKLIGQNATKALVEDKIIEAMPIIFARGRNFENAFVIFDELQNATLDGFELIAQRIHDTSKMILMGDADQIDLEDAGNSCIHHVEEIMGNLKDVKIIKFDKIKHNVRSQISRSVAKAFREYRSEPLKSTKSSLYDYQYEEVDNI